MEDFRASECLASVSRFSAPRTGHFYICRCVSIVRVGGDSFPVAEVIDKFNALSRLELIESNAICLDYLSGLNAFFFWH